MVQISKHFDHWYDTRVLNSTPDLKWQLIAKTQVYWKYCGNLPSSFMYKVFMKQIKFLFRLGSDILLCVYKYSKIWKKKKTKQNLKHLFSQGFPIRHSPPVLCKLCNNYCKMKKQIVLHQGKCNNFTFKVIKPLFCLNVCMWCQYICT
jgi:hypothetical protein